MGRRKKSEKQSSTSSSHDDIYRSHFRRVSITIREDQYQLLHSGNYSFSALIRDLLDDRFSSNKIVLNLSDHGKELYEVLVGQFGTHDVDLEQLFLKALDEFIGTKIEQMQKLREKMKVEP